jgi:hypothetical protein
VRERKRAVEETWSEADALTTVPMSLAKRPCVNPSNVTEEHPQALSDSGQCRMTPMNETKLCSNIKFVFTDRWGFVEFYLDIRFAGFFASN